MSILDDLTALQHQPLATHVPFDVDTVRADFPVLQQEVYGQPLVYLDNAATTQKPRAVLDRIQTYYSRENSNVHRGVHFLSQQATDAFEAARETVRQFINAPSTREIIFTRGTTEAVNLVASSYGGDVLQPGDEVVISTMEHHSNIVPWQMACEAAGAKLQIIPINDAGELDYNAYLRLLTERTRLVAIVHVSNALGTINPVRQMVQDAKGLDIPVLVDGAQAVPHLRVDVQDLGCDFYCFSGHKMFGPTGIGVLYGTEDLLDKMPPYQGGGDMIERVSFEGTTYNKLPHKFEAGTPNIAGTLGLATAINYLSSFGVEAVTRYEHDLLAYATARLQEIEGLRLYGTAAHKAGVLSFLLDNIHPYDTGTLLDRMGIAVRTGHHCTQPLMQRFGIPGTVRASLALYNTRADIDRLVEGLQRVRTMFA